VANNLFRPEVAAGGRRANLIGEIQLRPSRLGWFFFSLAIALVATVTVLLAGFRYTRSVELDGMLVPDRGLMAIRSNGAGTVAKVFVAEGSIVHAGDPLLQVSRDLASATLGPASNVVDGQLREKQGLLRRELDEFLHQAELKRADNAARTRLVVEQISQMEKQVALQRQRADSAMGVYHQWEQYGTTGAVSRVQLAQQRDAALASQAQVSDLRRQTLQLRQQKLELDGQQHEIDAEIQEKRNEVAGALADVTVLVSENEQRRGTLLTAPSEGRVANLSVHPGQSLPDGQSLMNVVPAGSKLVAEFWAPTRSIGGVAVGDEVGLRYDAYPFQRFGQQRGVVLEVSKNAISSAELSRMLGHDVQDEGYRVLVALDSESIDANGSREQLKPGMKLKGSVLLEKVRLAQWVFQPLQHLGGRR
jgi:membrane fusion protein